MTVAETKITDNEIEYIVTFDSKGNALKGGKNYRFHLPQNIPAANFWSIIVYDSQTSLIIHTDQLWPSVFSSCKSLVTNHDGSIDVRFGPKIPNVINCNWIKTISDNNWIMIFRLYNPQETEFDKSWRPEEIEEVK